MSFNFLELGSQVINTTQKDIASSAVELYNLEGVLLTEEIEYDVDGNLITSPLMAVVSTLAEEMAEMVFDGQTDNRRVDFIVPTDDLPELPEDGYYIMFNGVKYDCFQREGQPNAGKYSDQFNQRFRIHTRRIGE
jgi:hypothetical protein